MCSVYNTVLCTPYSILYIYVFPCTHILNGLFGMARPCLLVLDSAHKPPISITGTLQALHPG